jgi:hypothetical protein
LSLFIAVIQIISFASLTFFGRGSFVQLMGVDGEESLRVMRSIKELLGDSSMGMQGYAGTPMESQAQDIMLQAQAREIGRLQEKLLEATKAPMTSQIK